MQSIGETSVISIEGKWFKCTECGCNCFTYHGEICNEALYTCNSCHCQYMATKKPQEHIMNMVLLGDNKKCLFKFHRETFDLIYIDPPFNTGKTQSREQTSGETLSYSDKFGDDYITWLMDRVQISARLLKPTGSFFLHADWHEIHYIKVAMDKIFGRKNFMNEIIWAYDYGARSKTKWSAKHDNILWYVRDPNNYTFNFEEMERIPYMAPGLVGPEKAAKGKTLTDTWWHTIVPTNGAEKTGYPTQKPLGILKRIISIHSNPGDLVLDFFAGSGTTGMACLELNRRFVLIDENLDAIKVMKKRFEKHLESISWKKIS